METIGFEGGDYPFVRKVGVDLFVGIKGGECKIAHPGYDSGAPEKTAFSGRKMTLGLLRAADDASAVPRLADHEIVV